MRPLRHAALNIVLQSPEDKQVVVIREYQLYETSVIRKN